MMRALTGIRGIAALWVFLFHFAPTHSLPILSKGYLGVDLFFLLSGFILTHVYGNVLYLSNPKGLLDFYRNRVLRIFPLHIVALSLVVLAVIWVPDFTHHFDSSAFIWSDLWRNYFLIHAWTSFTSGWNAPAWSLSAEWLAYLFFPIALALLRRFSLLDRVAYICIAFTTMTIFYYATSLDQMAHAGKTGILRMITAFTSGMCLYGVFQENRICLNPWISLISFIGCILFNKLQPFALWNFSLLILLCAQGGSFIAKALSSKYIFYLGEISFSLYIIQWIIIELGRYAVDNGQSAKLYGPAFLLAFLSSVFYPFDILKPPHGAGQES